MANEKVSKGLLLYFSTLDCIEKIDDAELGKFIKTEMKWLAGNTDEPEYEEMGSFFLHSRIKEQIALRGYDAERKRKSRESKKTQQEEQEASVATNLGVKENDIDISPQVKDFLKWIDKDEWVKILNIIRRGLYYHRQSDLDYANDLLLQHFIKYGIWDGDNGVPINEEVCEELWNYIKAITVEPKVY